MTTVKGDKASIEFNICEQASRKCPDQVSDNANLKVKDEDHKCIHLSEAEDPGTFALIDQDRPDLGVSLSYESGVKCTAKKNYGLKINIECN